MRINGKEYEIERAEFEIHSPTVFTLTLHEVGNEKSKLTVSIEDDDWRKIQKSIPRKLKIVRPRAAMKPSEK